jgi:hypothetical protein
MPGSLARLLLWLFVINLALRYVVFEPRLSSGLSRTST